MQLSAFKMSLKPGMQQEYQTRHDSIWPELQALLKASGIVEYSIFFDAETSLLFAVQKKTDTSNTDDLKNDPIMQKWWSYMAGLMEINPDGSPVVIPLKNVFTL